MPIPSALTWAKTDPVNNSANIAVALAVHRPKSRGWGIDVSWDAVRTAAENVKLHGLERRVGVARADMKAAPLAMADEEVGLDLVVSNPPYVRPDEWPGLQPEIREHEPREALVAEPDGLFFYRAIARVARHTLAPGGVVAVEVPGDAASPVVDLFRAHGLENICVHRDLAGRGRVVTAVRGK